MKDKSHPIRFNWRVDWSARWWRLEIWTLTSYVEFWGGSMGGGPHTSSWLSPFEYYTFSNPTWCQHLLPKRFTESCRRLIHYGGQLCGSRHCILWCTEHVWEWCVSALSGRLGLKDLFTMGPTRNFHRATVGSSLHMCLFAIPAPIKESSQFDVLFRPSAWFC